MATINLGAIKFNWKGPYNNSTAYVVDDVVSSSGSSYVCIQASQGNAVGNATAYWNIMSLAGTNGSNGSSGDTFGLANKEIAFKTNAGALDGIAIGTAGQALKVNSGATGYEFGAVAGGKVGQVLQTVLQTVQSTAPSANAWGEYSNVNITITPSATSSKIWIGFNGIGGYNNWSGLQLRRVIGGSESVLNDAHGSSSGSGNRYTGLPMHGHSYSDTSQARNFNINYLDSPNTTSAVQYKLYSICHAGSTHYLGQSYGDANYTSVIRAATYINAWEILA